MIQKEKEEEVESKRGIRISMRIIGSEMCSSEFTELR